MPPNFLVNEVTTEISVTDAAALLTPQVLEMIVQAVMRRMEEEKRNADNQARERNLGAARQIETERYG